MSPLFTSSALERTRTVTPYGTTPSRWRVYQFHHQGKTSNGGHDRGHCCGHYVRVGTGPTGLEPATSRVTVECSNQAELRPPFPCGGANSARSLLTYSLFG